MEYFVVLAVLGIAVLATAVLPGPLHRLPLSMPILAVGLGAVLFSLPLGLDGPRPGADDDIAERLTELVVIVSLTGAGLKLRRAVGWRSWMTTWRLLGITMPLTVAAIAVLGSVGLGLPIASAVLLGAVLAPTDPVLASEVQLPGPGEDDDIRADSIRFALTSEAGLNDGLAFPLTNLAIAIAVGGNWFVGWFLDDVVLKLTVGLVAGVVLGRLIAWLTFGRRSKFAFARSGEGLVAFGITLTVYGVTELLHGYGFLAVFVAAVTLRQSERSHEFYGVMHDFADTLERIASLLFLLLLGGAAVDGALAGLTLPGVLIGLGVVFIVRPVAGWIGLLGTDDDAKSKMAISFFGIRGMGTIYYLAYAVSEEFFTAVRPVWAVAVFTILVSIVVHGVSAGPVLERIDRSARSAALHDSGAAATGTTPDMPTEEHDDTRPLAQRFADGLLVLEHSGSTEALVELYDDECAVGNVVSGATHHGRDGAASFWSAYRDQFDTVASTYRLVAGDDNGAVLEWETSATANDREIAYRGATVLQFDGDRIVRSMAYYDPAALGRQIIGTDEE